MAECLASRTRADRVATASSILIGLHLLDGLEEGVPGQPPVRLDHGDLFVAILARGVVPAAHEHNRFSVPQVIPEQPATSGPFVDGVGHEAEVEDEEIREIDQPAGFSALPEANHAGARRAGALDYPEAGVLQPCAELVAPA